MISGNNNRKNKTFCIAVREVKRCEKDNAQGNKNLPSEEDPKGKSSKTPKKSLFYKG